MNDMKKITAKNSGKDDFPAAGFAQKFLLAFSRVCRREIRKIFVSLFPGSLLLLSGNVGGEEAFPLSVPFLEKAPVIDGKEGKDEWKNALVLMDYSGNIQKKPSSRTKGFVGQYDGVLYYAVRAEHGSMENAANNVEKHDGSVYEDDSIELFIDFRGQGKDYLHIIANSRGTIMDSYVNELRKADLSYESGAKARGSFHKDHCYMEIAVPLAALRLGENETNLVGLGFMRYIRYNRDGQGAMGAVFHKPATWKKFQNPHPVSLVLKQARGRLMAGENQFYFSCYNKGKEPWQGIAVFGKEKKQLSFPGQQETAFTMKASFESGRETRAVLRIFDRKGKEILQWSRWGMVSLPFILLPKSTYIYDDEPLFLSFQILAPGKNIPLQVEVLDQKRNCTEKKIFYPASSPFHCQLKLKNKINILRCGYKGEWKECKIVVISSPWREK